MHTDTITTALRILDAQDWFYMMEDYGYTAAKERAQKNMRRFVEVTNRLGADAREALRTLWVATFKYNQTLRSFTPNPQAPQLQAAMEEAEQRVNAMIIQAAA